MIKRSQCRICASPDLEAVLDLGEQPLANAFLARAELGQPSPGYPLEFCRCANCGHAQLSVTVAPEVLFRNYPYLSGTSETIAAHFAAYARDLAERFLPQPACVVEIGSNDGTLLRAFDQRTTRVLGIEPARNVVAIARTRGIETVDEFFDERLARALASSFGRADAIIANNVVPHIDDLAGLVRGVEALLAPTGVFVAEFPYVIDLLEQVEYDTIYHEHLSYFSVRAAMRLFAQVGLGLFDVRHVEVHGGSLRVFVGRDRPPQASVARLLRLEEEFGLHSSASFRAFAAKARQQRDALRALLADLKAAGERIAGYGAAAKGNTLLNFCGIDASVLEYIVDLNPLKQGLYTPGSHIPVREPQALLADRPEYTLLLAWNFADEILRQQEEYRRLGGRFIIPIPLPSVV